MPEIEWRQVNSFVAPVQNDRLLSRRPCPICGSDAAGERVWSIDGFQFFSDSPTLPKRVDLSVEQCKACFALALNPCYTMRGLGVLLAEAGHSYGASEDRPHEQVDWLAHRGLLPPAGQLLDVGCYDGTFLGTVPAHTRRVGVDIDLAALERGRARYGTDVEFVHGYFESFDYRGQPDTITMFHVLEHLRDPGAALRKLRTLAHERTRLVVEVPVLDNDEVRQNDVNGPLPVLHLTHFTRASLANCLVRAGWQPVELHRQTAYNGLRVLAAPASIAEVAPEPADKELASLRLAAWREAIAEVEAALAGVAASCVAVWGAGLHTELLYHLTSLFRDRERRFVVVDRDSLKQNTTWRGVRVYAPDALSELPSGARVVLSSYSHQPELARELAEIAPDAVPVLLYRNVNRY